MKTNTATICKSNRKSFYSYINEIRIVIDKIWPLKTPDGIVVTTGNDMAKTQNDYVSSVFTHEQLNNIPQLDEYEGNTINTFNFRVNEVQKNYNILLTSTNAPDPISFTQESCDHLMTLFLLLSHTRFGINGNYTSRLPM